MRTAATIVVLLMACACESSGSGGGGSPAPVAKQTSASPIAKPGTPTTGTPKPAPNNPVTPPGNPVTPPGNPVTATPFEVIRTTPTNNDIVASAGKVQVVFNRKADFKTLRHNPSSTTAGTFRIFQRPQGQNNFVVVQGKLSAGTNNSISFQPSAAFSKGSTVILALTKAVTDTQGSALSTGSVSGPLTLTQLSGHSQVVFQIQFALIAPGAPAGASGNNNGGASSGANNTGSTTSPGVLSAAYKARSGTDVWHIDFVGYKRFETDLSDHGLGSGNPQVDEWAKHRVIARALAVTSRHYRLNTNGAAVSGSSFKISFSSDKPTGRVRKDYSREGVGGVANQSGILGRSFYDAGNRGKEDNFKPKSLGVFSGVISGRKSRLKTRLRASDLKFVDGSYKLGNGQSSDDKRFTDIRTVIDDWGQALALVLAHEVGHSVGLAHVSTNNRNIMHASTSSYAMSSNSIRFGSTSVGRLTANLGIDR
jgi:hypothetical protein